MRIREVAKFLAVTLFFAFSAHTAKSQTISPRFFGVNAWMPDTIGDVNNCADPPCIRYGKLHKNWKKIEDSKAMSVRYGGIGPDKNMPTKFQYIRMIDSIRLHGMEPIVQVPFYDGRYTAQQAADIVQYVNITRGRNVKYWIIGNEPNLIYSYTTAAQVAYYFKQFASAMKNIDPTIKIVGPETAAFKKTISDGLTNPGGPDDITGTDANGRYYLDVFTFHTYPFSNSSTTLPTRSQLISKLTALGGYQDDIAYMINRLNTANSFHGRSGTSALKLAITEANVVHTNHPSDNLYGVGANSFIGGQFVAEMYGIGLKQGMDFINLWSVIEGGNSVEDNCGYIDPLTGNKKPIYYHFQMMAENFKGSSINCTDNQLNIKAFGSKSSQEISVMIMNQDQSVNHPLTVKLNTTAITSTTSLNVNVNAGVNVTYTDNIPNQTTILLTFNASGTLIKKCVYSMTLHAASNQPPSCVQVQNPDLTITGNSLSQSSLIAGSSLTATSILKNSGSGTVTSNVSYYISTDNNFNTGDILLSTTSFPALGPGAMLQKQTVLTIPSNVSTGNYFLLHVADVSNAVTESSETNNVASNSFTVNSQSSNDVISLLPTSGATFAAQGTTIAAGFTIKNNGGSQLVSVNAGYYLSSDPVWGASDILLATDVTGALAPSASFASSKIITVPSSLPGGQYYILYYADNSSGITETNETNNISYRALSVSNSIDVTLISATLSNSTVVAGNNIVTTSTVKNLGINQSASSQIGYFLSSDTILDSNDSQLTAVSFGTLAPSASAVKTGTLTIPPSLLNGNYFIIAFADHANLLSEVSESNNQRIMPLKVNTMTTGVENSETEGGMGDIKIYPNPTSGPLILEMENSNQTEKEYFIEMFDIAGNRVMSRPMVFRDNKLEFIIPENLIKGIYILCVSDERKKITRKLILNR